MEESIRIKKILKKIIEAYPDASCALVYTNPLQLLVATILSAQCTDQRVNQVTPELFKKYPDAQAFAKVTITELGEAIKSCGFFNQKAKSIINCCQQLLEKHQGQVPADLEALTALPGVGRKTANVILSNAFGKPAIPVDTHVKRLANRLGLTTNKDPIKIEFDLMAKVPKKNWSIFSHALILHGRNICGARKPHCPQCVVNDLCPYPTYQKH